MASPDVELQNQPDVPPSGPTGGRASLPNEPMDDDNDPREYKPWNYHPLAEIMSRDNNFAIFRRFDDLNMLHLLALQAEILELRELFRGQCRRDDQGSPESSRQHLMYRDTFTRLESQTRDSRHPRNLYPGGTLERLS
jgi:hypothetical protein